MPSILSRPSFFGYGFLARSFQGVDWLTGFPLHFPNKSEMQTYFWMMLASCILWIQRYLNITKGLTRLRYILVIFYIFYCHWGEECRSLYRELRCDRNSLYGGSIVQATAANMQTAICVGPFSLLKISMHLSLGIPCEQALLLGRASRERASEGPFLCPSRLRRSLARSRETCFARPNRRACSQASLGMAVLPWLPSHKKQCSK